MSHTAFAPSSRTIAGLGTSAAGDRPAAPPYPHDDGVLAAARADGQAHVRVYRLPETVVVLGRGSRPEREIRAGRCAADGVPVLRRRGGGCAVVVDPGNVVVSAARPDDGREGVRELFARLTGWLIAGLASIGVDGVRRLDVSDLVVGERKVGGACLYRSAGVMLYAVTLLVEPRVELMARYLAHPPREPAYRLGRAHAAFVGPLRELAGAPPAARFAERLSRALERSDR